jgi:predicted MFS family arabinose efflux permease
MLAPDLATLGVLRIPTGFALGAVSATCMATASRSATPEATFGVINAAVGAMGILIAWVLPRAIGWGEPLTEMAGNRFEFDELDGLYVVYLICGLSAYLFVRGTPSVHDDGSGPAVTKVAPKAGGWVALIAIGFLFFGHGALGIFLVRAARELGMSPEIIGYVFMAGAVFGIVVPLTAGYVGSRMKPFLPLTVIVCILLVACLIVATTKSVVAFGIAMPLFGSLPMAFLPIMLGVLSRYDPSGTLAGAHAAFVLAGGALAPFAGGFVRDMAQDYSFNGYFACACIFIAFVVLLPIIRADGAASRHQSGSPLPTASH